MIILFSVDKGKDARRDAAARIVADAYLKERNIAFSYAEGCYKGVKEESYQVEYKGHSARHAIDTLAIAFEQESILLVDENGQASEHVIGMPEAKPLGAWTNVTQSEAIVLEGYTYVKGEYYVVK